MPKPKYVAKIFFWNAIMSAVVFLPVFLVMAQFQALLLVGPPTRTTFLTELSNAIYFYLIFVLPLMLGSLVYSAVALLIPNRWILKYRRLTAVLLSILLPVTVFLLNLPGGLAYQPFYVPTVVAIILYGMCARIGEETLDGRPMERRASE